MNKKIYTKELLKIGVENCNCYKELFDFIKCPIGGNSYQRIKNLILEYELDTSHFLKNKAGYMKAKLFLKKKHFNEILILSKSNRRQSGKRLKKALIESGVPYICSECGIPPIWNNKELTLQVHHINGNYKDCRKNNLVILCPNCHTQTDNFCNLINKFCKICGKKITKNAKHCRRCNSKFVVKKKRKVENRPSVDVLLQDIENLGYRGTGKKYNVSDNCIRKWIK